MSSMSQRTLTCPHCGDDQDAQVWESVNVTLDPELKNELLEGKINFLVCRKCGKRAFVDVPLLYHDMTKQFCVQYYPREALGDDAFFRHFNVDGTTSISGVPPAVAAKAAHLSRPHIVFDMGEMARYVLFREGIWHREDPANQAPEATSECPHDAGPETPED